MGKRKKVDIAENPEVIKDTIKSIESKAKFDVKEIFDLITTTVDEGGVPVTATSNAHIPTNTLALIQAKLGKKKEIVREDGTKEMVPEFSEEQKTKALFAMMAERGINLLDYYEKLIASEGPGFQNSNAISFADLFSKVGEYMRDVAEIQFRAEKLRNERELLAIQRYKADLKKMEIEAKLAKNEKPTGNNIIAVGNVADLLNLMQNSGMAEANAEVIDAELLDKNQEDV
jgi:hypothetical protein